MRVRQAAVSVSAIIASSRVRITALLRLGARSTCASQCRARAMSSPPYSSSVSAALAVAAGAADLLVIRLRTVRHVEMHDEAHVRPVDAHAEGDRRHHHHRLAGAETAQRRALFRRRQAGMENDRVDLLLLQTLRRPLGLGAAAAIDDAGLPGMMLQERQQLGGLADLRRGGDVQVGAVEAGGEHLRVAHRRAIAGCRSRVRGSAVAVSATRGTPGKRSRQACQRAIFGPELVPPLR